MEQKIRWRALYHNRTCYLGGAIILVSLLLILSLVLLNITQTRPSPYLGIFTYMILPAVLLLGILIFLSGLIRESRRRRMGIAEAMAPFILDLNKPKQRRLLIFLILGGWVFVILLSLGGYKAYHFTESDTFCGKICHSVMKPEYTAYLNSPHARVPCVECHVGPGVSWFVKSKVSGVPQVFATLLRTYPKPIPVPIKNLRPARETCEKCHWPAKFYPATLLQIPHYRYSEKPAAEQISFLVKTGGGTAKGESMGIHWHMVIQNKVYFKATDSELQHIPWVKLVLPDGSETVFFDKRVELAPAELERLPTHLVDCMNCHNRPTHIFPGPEPAVEMAMVGGEIPPLLPWIKKVAVEALIKEYPGIMNPADGIRQAVEGYYAQNFPAVFKDQKARIDQAVSAIASIYDRIVFPGMKVNWSTYPNNIGHRNWPGCFLCHDGYHVNQSGKVIADSCTVCHTMPQRGPLQPLGGATITNKEPWHPWALKGKHGRILCHVCHQAGNPAMPGCASCHRISTSAVMMSMDCSSCHRKEGEVLPLVKCRSCHSDLKGLHKKKAHASSTCTDCHQPHSWEVTERKLCLACHADKQDHHASSFCGDCHSFEKSWK